MAVISETMARRHWSQDSPIGARILFGDTLEVVGVCADVVHESLDAEPLATLYVPFLLESASSINFIVRTTGDPSTLFPALRRAVWEVDPEAPISRVATLSSLIHDSARGESFRTLLILVFAGSATLLAGAGVFGVTARRPWAPLPAAWFASPSPARPAPASWESEQGCWGHSGPPASWVGFSSAWSPGTLSPTPSWRGHSSS